MPGLIHPIELQEKLRAESHLFLPSLRWDKSSVASAMQVVSILRKQDKKALILAPLEWRELIPEHWPLEYFIFNEDDTYDLEFRPEWVWLWGLGFTKEHSQELKSFLIGCDTIQIIDWTQSKLRKWGQFIHPVPYLGGIPEFTFNLCRDLLPIEKWEQHYLPEAFEDLYGRYPFLTHDTPLVYLFDQIDFSQVENHNIDHNIELYNKTGIWYTYTVASDANPALLNTSIQKHYFASEATNAIYLIESGESENEYYISINTPDHFLELKTREKFVKTFANNPNGSFSIDELEKLIDELIQELEEGLISLKPWPKGIHTGTTFKINCSDPQWEFEKEQRLNSMRTFNIEEEEDEEEIDEELLETIDWNSSQLLSRIHGLRPIALKLRERDLSFNHQPVIRLDESATKENFDHLLAEYQLKLDILENEKKELERLEALEKERIEREELQRLETLENERLEKEELQRLETLENERLEKEELQRLEDLENERVEREELQRLEDLENERIEKEELQRLENLENERVEREELQRLENLENERVEREELQRLEDLENEKIKREEQLPPDYLQTDKDNWNLDQEEELEDEEIYPEDMAQPQSMHRDSGGDDSVEFPSYEEFLEAMDENEEESENLNEQNSANNIINELTDSEEKLENIDDTQTTEEKIIEKLGAGEELENNDDTQTIEEKIIEELNVNEEPKEGLEIVGESESTPESQAENILIELDEDIALNSDEEHKENSENIIISEDQSSSQTSEVEDSEALVSDIDKETNEELIKELGANEAISEDLPAPIDSQTTIETDPENILIELDTPENDEPSALETPLDEEPEEEFIRYNWDTKTSTDFILNQVRSPKRLFSIDLIYTAGFLFILIWLGLQNL